MVQSMQRNNGNPKGITKIMDSRIAEIANEISEWDNRYIFKLLQKLGVGSQYYTCQRCNRVLLRGDFYVSTEPGVKSQITNICKACANEIAMPTVNGVQQPPTKNTVDAALRALNKPMLEKLWESSLYEAANTVSGKPKKNAWTSYIKNIQMVNYGTMTYEQSDGYTSGNYSVESIKKNAKSSESQEIIEQFEKNKKDTLRLLGYLPFEQEKLSDQPFLYAQLIGFLDSSPEGNDDMMRTQSIITIVRGFLQISQIDDMVAQALQDPKGAIKNVANIKAYEEISKNISMRITKLAEQSCISLKNSKNSKKGENTWTGKIKKIKEISLREGEVNGFDIGTCRGMQQVLDMSNASILKQLSLDESEWSDIVKEQRDKLTTTQKEKDIYQEIARVLLRENLDLKDTLKSKGVSLKDNLVDLPSLFSPFSEISNTTPDPNEEIGV
ncbi:hypothetical protein [Enterocloster citroniae]|uniref:Uncharacterized protein n=1 Tax=[Clostridium] citroniae WAL-17108 TaxID=742733 RepID=G5HER7_9FIRM|nr:hypothetical protein [Enterocloster citroniae]EHF00026.1 hypothetical protein HMPREF9469_00940 [ [[Clostridium] citroniae WAL-17108]MCC3383285.1 hypothetical protein [Enterocloster citroniae]